MCVDRPKCANLYYMRGSNETHQSSTDPQARLMRKGKGKEAKLAFMGHALMENGNGLLLDFVVSSATGTAERDAVPVMLDDAWERGFRPRTLAGDKGYDTRQCVKDMRDRGDIRVDEDGGRLPPNPVSGCGAYWAGGLLGSYRLQLGADVEPVVVSEDSGRSGRVTCRGRSVPKWAAGASKPRKSPT